MTSSDPFWTSIISWISSVSIRRENNILESVKQLCNWKNEVCSIFDFKQLTVPKNWISSQSNPFWLYGFCKEHSQIMSLLRISVWPWSFSLSVSICGHPWLLCGLSWPPRDQFIIFLYSFLQSIELPIDYVVYQIMIEQWKPQWVINWVKRHRFLRFIRCILTSCVLFF